MKKPLLLTLFMLLPFQAHANETCPKTISIGGALTEIVYKLWKQHCLVGADTTSTYPAAATELPMVGYQRMLNAEGILSLKPELIIHTDSAGPAAALTQIDHANIKRINIKELNSLEGVLEKIRVISNALDAKNEGDALISTLKAEYEKLIANTPEVAPKVLFLMMHGGGAPMAGGKGTAADAIIALAGGTNVITFERYKPLTPEAMVSLNPDIIVTTDDTLKQIGGAEGLLKTLGLQLTKAGQNKTIISMDALLMLGFGPRTIEAAQTLSQEFQQAL